jgi:hypothetical protein
LCASNAADFALRQRLVVDRRNGVGVELDVDGADMLVGLVTWIFSDLEVDLDPGADFLPLRAF